MSEALAPAPTEAATLRAGVYGLLAELLQRPPDGQRLARLRALAIPAHEDAALAPAWRALRDAARDTDAEALDDEYHALFIGLGRGELLPFASWYLNGALLDRPLAAVRGDLARLGIGRREDVAEPEDHAGAILEAMGLMAGEGFAQEEQRAFFERHVAGWMPSLMADLDAAPGSRFYRAVAALGTAFLDLESRYLQSEA